MYICINRVIFDNLRQKCLCYRACFGISESPKDFFAKPRLGANYFKVRKTLYLIAFKTMD